MNPKPRGALIRPIALLLILFSALALGAKAKKKCAGVAGLEPQTEDATTRYLRLLQHYGVEKQALDESDYQYLLEVDRPVNPFDEDKQSLGHIKSHAYRGAFARVLAEGGIDWPRVQAGIAPLLGKKRANVAREANAREKTAFVLEPVPVPNEFLPLSDYAEVVGLRSWGASIAYGTGFDANSAGWHFRESPSSRAIPLEGEVTQVVPRKNEGPLVVTLIGTPKGRPMEARVVDGRTGEIIHRSTFERHPTIPLAPALSTTFVVEPVKGKKVIFSAWGSGNHGEWEPLGGGTKARLPEFPAGMRFIPSHDAKKAYAMGVFPTDKGYVAAVYDAFTGKEIKRVPYPGGNTRRENTHVFCNSKGELYLVALGENGIVSVDFARGKATRHFVPYVMKPATPGFLESPGGNVSFAFASHAQAITLVDVSAGHEATLQYPAQVNVNTDTFHFLQLFDGRRVVAATTPGALQLADFDARSVTTYRTPKIDAFLTASDGRLIGLFTRERNGTGPYGQPVPVYEVDSLQIFGPRIR